VPKIEKRDPAPDYPPEEGCYLRGNDYSPVAVVVLLRWIREQTPPEIEQLVRVGVESGAALSGTLQTENIGIEKVICNIVANPNIRYLIVCGPESPGHLVGAALLSLARNGINERRRIIGAPSPTPYLFNLPPGHVERFRKQVSIINLVDEGSPDVLRQAVAACYQEEPTVFRDCVLHDPGAYPEPPLSGKLTWRVTQPEREPKNDEDRAEGRKFADLQQRIRKAVAEKRHVPCADQRARKGGRQ
jgi:tetrahydromethanopterin S-methyltransferase subunit A